MLWHPLDWIEWIAYQNKEINEFVGIFGIGDVSQVVETGVKLSSIIANAKPTSAIIVPMCNIHLQQHKMLNIF